MGWHWTAALQHGAGLGLCWMWTQQLDLGAAKLELLQPSPWPGPCVLSPGSDSTTGMCGECQHTALENGKKTAKGKRYLGLFFCEKLKKKMP